MKNLGILVTGVILGLLLSLGLLNRNHSPAIVEKEKIVEVEVIKEVVKEVEKVVVKREFVDRPEYIFIYPAPKTRVLYVREASKKNRIYFIAGGGPAGLDVQKVSPHVIVSQKNDLVTGLGFQRRFDNLVLGLEFLSNGSVLGTLGTEF